MPRLRPSRPRLCIGAAALVVLAVSCAPGSDPGEPLQVLPERNEPAAPVLRPESRHVALSEAPAGLRPAVPASAPVPDVGGSRGGPPPPIHHAAWSGDGQRFALAAGRRVLVYRVDEGAYDDLGPGPAEARFVAFGARGDLAIAHDTGEIHVWDPARRQRTVLLPASLAATASSDEPTFRLAVSSAGRFVAGLRESALSTWRVSDAALLDTFDTLGPAPGGEEAGWYTKGGFAFTPDERFLVTVGPVGAWRRELPSLADRGTFYNGTGATFGTSISPDGSLVAAGADDGHTLRVWPLASWPRFFDVATAPDCDHHVNPWFGSSTATLFTSFGDETRGYEVGSYRRRPIFRLPAGTAGTTLTFGDHGRTAVVMPQAGSVELWDTQPVRRRVSLAVTPVPGAHDAGTVEVSPGERFVSRYTQTSASVWSAADGRLLLSWP